MEYTVVSVVLKRHDYLAHSSYYLDMLCHMPLKLTAISHIPGGLTRVALVHRHVTFTPYRTRTGRLASSRRSPSFDSRDPGLFLPTPF